MEALPHTTEGGPSTQTAAKFYGNSTVSGSGFRADQGVVDALGWALGSMLLLFLVPAVWLASPWVLNCYCEGVALGLGLGFRA